MTSEAGSRREAGYNYAKENYEQLIAGMDPKKDVFRIVSHSMGGVFSDGMIAYLKECGWNIEAAVHFNAYEPHEILKWTNTTLIDATNTNDWVQHLNTIDSNENIPNADFRIRKKSEQGFQYRHRDLINNGDIWRTNSGTTWNQAMSLIQSWLQRNSNIKVSYE